MRSSRILLVDDDPDVLSIAELSLMLDPDFAVKTCASGGEVPGIMAGWAPDLILCDVMMPVVDGRAVLARLRENKSTANIPFVFMTAAAQPRELQRLMSLGAVAVIVKPFDTAKLADTVRGHLRPIGFAAADENFAHRLGKDAAELAKFRKSMPAGTDLVPDHFLSCVHKLAGASGVFGLQAVSSRASALEDAIKAQRSGRGTPGKIEADLDALLECIGPR